MKLPMIAATTTNIGGNITDAYLTKVDDAVHRLTRTDTAIPRNAISKDVATDSTKPARKLITDVKPIIKPSTIASIKIGIIRDGGTVLPCIGIGSSFRRFHLKDEISTVLWNFSICLSMSCM
jgi:hypothetical protein